MLSIDGTKTIHDKSRRYGNGSPSWDDIIANLKKLPDFEKYIMARVTVLNTDVPLLEIYKTMRTIGFLDIAMTEICPNSGEMPMFPDKEIPRWKEQYLELAEYIANTEPDAYNGGLASCKRLCPSPQRERKRFLLLFYRHKCFLRGPPRQLLSLYASDYRRSKALFGFNFNRSRLGKGLEIQE